MAHREEFGMPEPDLLAHVASASTVAGRTDAATVVAAVVRGATDAIVVNNRALQRQLLAYGLGLTGF